MRLFEFVSAIRAKRGEGPLDREVNGLAWDSRRTAPGNLFVAIPRAGRDTQAAVDAALERGATAVLCQGREVVSARATRVQVDDVRAALPRVSELFFSQPDRRLKVIGVAGSCGTAAPAMLLKKLLDAAGFKCGIIGTAGCEVGERQLPPLRKNCESLDYQELLAQMVRVGCGACIIEFGPDAIEQNRLGDIAFDAVIFGSFDADPTPGRGSALVQFCRALANGPKRFTAAFNIDDPICKALWESGACPQTISYGFNAGAEVRGSQIELAPGSVSMVIGAGTAEIRCRTPLTGRQNALNILAACAGAAAFRIPLALIRFTLQKVKILPGSLERVGMSDVAIYVDGARSENELRRALDSLREITRGNVLLVFGSPAGESAEKRFQIGRLAASSANYTVITADNPGREQAFEIAAQIERGFDRDGKRTHHVQLDRSKAIEDAIQMAAPGDAVLIAGKGFENHQEFADTIVPFDDREQAIAALELRGAMPVKAAQVIERKPAAPARIMAFTE